LQLASELYKGIGNPTGSSARRQPILEEEHDQDTVSRGSQEIIDHDRATWYGVGLLSR